jgi:magnesium chelatase family protein
LSRAAVTLSYPSNFMLVAAMNPCPCGYLTDPTHECKCTPEQVRRYLSKVSGPLLDRIDLHVEVPRVQWKDLTSPEDAVDSETCRRRIAVARGRQRDRFTSARADLFSNSQMSNREIERFAPLDAACMELLHHAIERMGLSARAYHRIRKIARTIADLEESEEIRLPQVMEAVQYRSLDRIKELPA